MNNRRFLVLFVAMVALILTPMVLSAQATDTATLTLTGQVPSIVKIGFGSVTTNGTLDLGDLNANSPSGVTGTDTSVIYVANVGFTIDVSSQNGGVLTRQGGAVSGFKNDVGYSLTFDGSGVSIPGAGTDVEIVSNGTPGAYTSSTIDIAVDPLSIDNFDETSTLTDVEAAGTYEDVLTFTITSTN